MSTEKLINAIKTEQYNKGALDVDEVDRNPAIQFQKWFKEAQDAKITLPEALNLATAELPSGRVSNRVVLLKELDKDGRLVIYSNWGYSRKGNDLKTNSWVSLCFWWKDLERQVRVEGRAQRLSLEESSEYFHQRPRGSQLGAWASHQSQPVPSREALEQAAHAAEEKYGDSDIIPCPPYWGGVAIRPERWEFWQGRPSRLHDRLEYVADQDSWKINRICP